MLQAMSAEDMVVLPLQSVKSNWTKSEVAAGHFKEHASFAQLKYIIKIRLNAILIGHIVAQIASLHLSFP